MRSHQINQSSNNIINKIQCSLAKTVVGSSKNGQKVTWIDSGSIQSPSLSRSKQDLPSLIFKDTITNSEGSQYPTNPLKKNSTDTVIPQLSKSTFSSDLNQPMMKSNTQAIFASVIGKNSSTKTTLETEKILSNLENSNEEQGVESNSSIIITSESRIEPPVISSKSITELKMYDSVDADIFTAVYRYVKKEGIHQLQKMNMQNFKINKSNTEKYIGFTKNDEYIGEQSIIEEMLNSEVEIEDEKGNITKTHGQKLKLAYMNRDDFASLLREIGRRNAEKVKEVQQKAAGKVTYTFNSTYHPQKRTHRRSKIGRREFVVIPYSKKIRSIKIGQSLRFLERLMIKRSKKKQAKIQREQYQTDLRRKQALTEALTYERLRQTTKKIELVSLNEELVVSNQAVTCNLPVVNDLSGIAYQLISITYTTRRLAMKILKSQKLATAFSGAVLSLNLHKNHIHHLYETNKERFSPEVKETKKTAAASH